MREGGLLSWQWLHYAEGHRTRRNLAVHAVTAPLFILGSCSVLAAAFAGAVLAGVGAVAMVVAVVAQARGHAREPVPPQPILGPGDLIARLVVEQWVTFPRFVLSGGFARAWREAGQEARSASA